MSWQKLDPASSRVDPYLSWARDAGGIDFLVPARDEQSPSPSAPQFIVIAELADHVDRAQLGSQISERGARFDSRYFLDKQSVAVTLWFLDMAHLIEVLNFLETMEAVLRVELATPMGVPEKVWKSTSEFANPRPARSTSNVLFGVIDDACPFARPAWSERILALWEQGRTRAAATPAGLPQLGFPARPGYGWEHWRDQDALDAFFLGHAVPSSLQRWKSYFTRGTLHTVDEAALYEAGGFIQMRRRLSHGAHVLDLMAGPVLPSTRIDAAGVNPPAFGSPAVDYAAQQDIVFVQLPKTAVEDTSGRWLGAHIIDGLRYILSFAGHGQLVVANVSYGATTGPHDGTSVLEEAIDRLCAENNGSNGTPQLRVVVPTGNSFSAQSHAVLEVDASSKSELTWRVLPDGHRPTFLELWFPEDASPRDLVISVRAPTATTPAEFCTGTYSEPTLGAAVIFKQYARGRVMGGDRLVALIALSPTAATHASPGALVSPAGDWEVAVVNNGTQPIRVDAFVARSTPHFNFPRTGTLSYLVSSGYDESRYERKAEDDTPGAQPIRRRGTINGIATGAYTMKAAGHRVSDGKHALYSSAGPNRNGFTQVTCSFPTDFSRSLVGILGGGNVGVAASRLIGTSCAAPQLSRLLANNGGTLPPRQSAIATPNRLDGELNGNDVRDAP